MLEGNLILRKTLLVFIVVLAFFGCSTTAMRSNSEYRSLLMYSQIPRDVYGYKCEGGFLQFQNFEQTTTDTIVILKFDNNDRFSFNGGISVGEGYQRFENMKVIEYKSNFFFVVTARNLGNANGNRLYMYYIDQINCQLYPVEVIYAADSYSERLSEDIHIWDDETIDYKDNLISSTFYLWNKTDSHPYPTGGKVSVIYDIERLSNGKFRLYPVNMSFTK